VSRLDLLFHHRWAVPLLAALGRTPGRFSNLMHALGTGRESLIRALDGLVELGLIARTPGYGHPLRPEYLLLPAGAALVPAAVELMRGLERLEAQDVGLKKWSMPVVHALGTEPRCFSELREHLTGVTPRALALALKDLTAAGLAERTVTVDFPPATVYRLTPAAGQLLDPLERLSRPS
jgi:DNA-binding HxlR family transcriptional regulator